MKWGERKQQKFIDTIDAASATSIRYIVRYIDCFNISIQRDIDRYIDLSLLFVSFHSRNNKKKNVMLCYVIIIIIRHSISFVLFMQRLRNFAYTFCITRMTYKFFFLKAVVFNVTSREINKNGDLKIIDKSFILK